MNKTQFANFSNGFFKSKIFSSWILALSSTLIFANLILIIKYSKYLGVDSSLYIYSAKLIDQGFVPFKDFYEINPPFVMYFHFALLKSAELFKIPTILFFLLFTWTWATFDIFLAFKIVSRNFKRINSNVFVLAASLLCFIFFENQTFGQRDFLFAFALIPYFAWRSVFLFRKRDILNNSEKWIVMIKVGLAILFKPFFISLFLIVEAWVFFRTKRTYFLNFSWALTFPLLLSLLYFIYLVFLMGPEGKDYFWNYHVPLITSFGHGMQLNYYDFKLSYFFETLLLITTAVFATQFNFRNYFIRVLFVGIICSWLIYFLQNRFFEYHLVPVKIFSFLFVVAAAQINSKNFLKKKFSHFLLLSYFVFYVMKAITSFELLGDGSQPIAINQNLIKDISNVLDLETKDNDNVLFLTGNPWISFPIINYRNLNVGSRYLYQYPLIFFARQRLLLSPESLSQQFLSYEATYIRDLKDDIKNFKPKVIFVIEGKSGRQLLPIGFSTEKYFIDRGVIQELNLDYRRQESEFFEYYTLKK